MKTFICNECEENAPMLHTGTNCTTGKWIVLAVINADGSHLYDNTDADIETENLRAFCGCCGAEIDGATFCDIAWPKEEDTSKGYSYRIQNLPVGHTFVFPKSKRNIVSGIVTVKQQHGKGKWKIVADRDSTVATCTRTA